jgi:hypothetical protein
LLLEDQDFGALAWRLSGPTKTNGPGVPGRGVWVAARCGLTHGLAELGRFGRHEQSSGLSMSGLAHGLAELGRFGRHEQSSGLFMSGLAHGLAELGRFGRHEQSPGLFMSGLSLAGA